MKKLISKIENLSLEDESHITFGASLSVEKMKLKINIGHYKFNSAYVRIIFENFESFNTVDESHLTDKWFNKYEKIVPFFYVLNQDSIYAEFMKNNSALGVVELNNPNELKFYRILCQNIYIDIICKSLPIVQFI